MLQYLGSYIWGAEEDHLDQVQEYNHEEVEIENEWLYIPKDNENKRKRSSSESSTESEDDDRDFNLAECNLFHHEEESMDLMSPVEERLHEIEKAEARTVGKRGVLSKRMPLKDLNAKISIIKKKDSPKNLKRSNHVNTRVQGARKNKQMGRMQGKHTACVAPRTR
jgi:hypothetical protein